MLADRGLNVEDSVAYKDATLNIPAFTKEKSQLSPGDVESLSTLPNVRIHMSRVIGSVRQKFQLLSEAKQQQLPTKQGNINTTFRLLLTEEIDVKKWLDISYV